MKQNEKSIPHCLPLHIEGGGILLWLVLSLALLTRLAYFFQYAGTPFYAVPMWDAGEYHDMALALSKGSLHPAFAFRPPLYPLLLGVVYMLFGVGPLVPSLLQLAGGVYTCVLVQRIGTRLFGRWAGFGAGLAAALSGMMVFYDLELMPTSLEVLLMLLLLNELIRFADREEWESRKVGKSEGNPPPTPPCNSRGGTAAGVIFALGVLARPVMLPLLPVFMIWLWWIRLDWRRIAVFGAIGLSALVVNAGLNLAAGNGALMTPAQGGVNFYIGNRVGADGFTATLPNVGSGWGWDTITKLAEKQEGRRLTPTQVDRYYWKAGWKGIGEAPTDWIRLMWRKARLFWNRLEISNDRDIYYHARRYPVMGWLLWMAFPLFLPFALVGLWIFAQDKRVALLGAVLIVYSAVVVVFFVNGRFRHPLTPLLIILAAGGLRWIVELLKRKDFQWNRLKTGAVAMLAVGIITPYSVDTNIDPRRWDYGYFTEATALEKMGRTDEAIRFYQKALVANPRAPFVNYNLGEIESGRGNFAKAADFYYNETVIQPHYGKAWNNLGMMVRKDDPEKALEYFEMAVRVRPDLIDAAVNAAGLWRTRGEAALRAGDEILAQQALGRAEELEKEVIAAGRQ